MHFHAIVMTALLLGVIAVIMPGGDCTVYTLFRAAIARATEISLSFLGDSFPFGEMIATGVIRVPLASYGGLCRARPSWECYLIV